MSPKVSWLLCTNTFNALTRRALDSCLDQSFTDYEVVVVVNGPIAESMAKEIDRAYEGFGHNFRVFHTSISQLNFSLSYGLHLCRGEYVARMDSDDISLFDRLSRQVAYLDSNPSVGVVSSSYFLVDENGVDKGLVSLPVTDKSIKKALYFGNPICHPSVMFRRSIVQNAGGYLGARFSEDYDLWVRLAFDNCVRFYSFSDPLIKYNIACGGEARGAKDAYVNVGAIQTGRFILGGNPRWLIGACLSFFKAHFYSKRKS